MKSKSSGRIFFLHRYNLVVHGLFKAEDEEEDKEEEEEKEEHEEGKEER